MTECFLRLLLYNRYEKEAMIWPYLTKKGAGVPNMDFKLWSKKMSNCQFLFKPYYLTLDSFTSICDALRDFVPFIQFKKRKKHTWRSVAFSKVADLWMSVSNTAPWVFFTFSKLY